MSLPRMNLTASENVAWVSSAQADTSFVTGVPVLMDDRAAIEIVYTGLDAADAWVKLQASNSGDATRARDLASDVITMTTANSSILFNVYQVGYGYIHLVYDAGSNTKGSVTARLTRKQKS